MTREEAITNYIVPAIKRTWNDKKCKEILEALEQEPKTEKVFKMRNATPEEQKSVDDYIKSISKPTDVDFWDLEQNPKIGYCKDCKYFEYDSVAKVDGIPLIVAHEICSRWGDGCKTKEDGYCFLFEPQEGEE